MKKELRFISLILLLLTHPKLQSQCWFSISSGANHNVVTRSNGTLWTWGSNSNGQLGDGTTINKLLPTQIGSSNQWWITEAGSDHSIARKNDGTIWTWGSNSHGQLGDGTTVAKLEPTQMGTDTNWIIVYAGGNCSFAVKTDGTLWAWGENNYGQLGDGTVIERHVPVLIATSASNSDRSLACSGKHTIACINSRLYGWGLNNYGQVGDGTFVDKHSPVEIGPTTWQVAVGSYHSVALRGAQQIYTWGLNDRGQLGDGTNTNKNIPTLLLGITSIQDINAEGKHTIAVVNNTSDDYLSIYNWGENTNGQLGNGTNSDSNIPVALLPNNYWYQVSSGNSHSMALDSDNNVISWGLNDRGQLGNGTTLSHSTPQEVNCTFLNNTENGVSPKYYLYPNPAKGIVYFDATDAKNISLYTVLGVKITSKEISADSGPFLDISNLPNGIYIAQIKTLQNSEQSLKLVIEN